MLVWIVGKDGLLGSSMMGTMKVAHIGSSRNQVDVLNPSMIEAFYLKHKPTHIVNCTAIVEVDKAEGELSQQAEEVNIHGIENLALLAHKYHLKLLHISTDYVFDGTKKEAHTEEDRVNPVNKYGLTKFLGEQNLLEILPTAVIIRTASVFGPAKYGLIDSLVDLLQGKEECCFVTDQISTPTYVDDIVAATCSLLDAQGIYHFVNKGFCSRYELLCFVKDLMVKYQVPLKCIKIGKSTQENFPRPAIRPVRSVLSTKKIEPLLGFSIRSWQDAVENFFVGKWGKGD
ncbi:MAG: dTDP-4-dehydrorhamnose reductase [Chlamydiia bacterium]|nr:dTDP-4-dehydrorhamnose reductase [Chlamydiia bacterium]MCH9618568.1 dTDP-4-dehydrorhamnose reductase [Chlamydiia bacterium]MCH9623893.1 dTDP-4-dehydrorhamnose reductase [Chlamydiia bacterium]